MTQHYFYMSSEVYGTEEFGPYDTEDEAYEGLVRVMKASYALRDGVGRQFWYGTDQDKIEIVTTWTPTHE